MFSAYIRRAEENGKIIFPKRFRKTDKETEDFNDAHPKVAVKSLELLQQQKGPYEFGCQYYNDLIDDASIEFKREWFRQFIPDDITLTQLQTAPCIISVDPAFKLKETHDQTGIIISKTLSTGIYILEALGLKLSPDKLIEKIFELVEIYNPVKVKIETVSAQILLADMLRKEMTVRHKMFMLDEYNPGTSQTKTVRIRKLIPFYANGQILHRRGLVNLEEQLVQFPRGRRDDIIDALAAQVNDWNPKSEYKVTKFKPWTGGWWKQRINRGPRNIEQIFSDLRRY